MDKREFLKMSGALLAGGAISRMVAEESRTNWSGNYTYKAKQLLQPNAQPDLQELVKKASKAKALGQRHSFNNIADTTGDHISAKHLTSIKLDTKIPSVTVGAGVTYGHLAPVLGKEGYAVHNLASLPHVSVVGACATATHGSGIKNGNLSTAVRAFEFVNGKGELVKLSRDHDGDHFAAAVVGLGALGVITSITLDVLPTFQVAQVVYENLSFAELEKNFDEVFGGGYSVSLFTDWQHHRATQVWVKRRMDQGGNDFKAEYFGAKRATQKLHPLAGHSAENCTEQMGIPGPWYERLPHFRMNFTPSSGAELQSEFFVPRERGYEAILAVEKLREHITPYLFITELRTVAADNLWMSPCHQRANLGIHFTWKPEWPAVKNVLPLIEKALAPFDVRPHWAKLFTMDPAAIAKQYDKLTAFRDLIQQHDPSGKFRNEYLSRNIYGAA
jgi:alditol oxidase